MPLADDIVHIAVAHKEHHQAIRNHTGQLSNKATVVTHVHIIKTLLVTRADGGLREEQRKRRLAEA
jgi:hypothetical protein